MLRGDMKRLFHWLFRAHANQFFATDIIANDHRRLRPGAERFRQIPGAVYDWTQLGLTEDPRRKRFPVIEAATIETLKTFYEKEIKPRPKLISIVGDSSKIDLEALGKIGPVTKVTKEEIFTY